MTLTVGTYHFKRFRNRWTVWVCEYAQDGLTSSSRVKNVDSYEEAVRETYRLNGWGEPKSIYKRF